MISKNKQKLINSLAQKKFRNQTGLFLAEGTKLVTDLSLAMECVLLVATLDWLEKNNITTSETVEVSQTELSRLSNQKTPQGVLALFKKPEYSWSAELLKTELSLALDDVQDPGNMGTIIRIADWFGIKNVFCSEFCADVFSPKTIQATMGAIARVNVHTVDLPGFLAEVKTTLPVYGTFMDGENIYSSDLEKNGIIVMGNEGNGISELTEKQITKRLLIPNFPEGTQTSESLNVGVATALVCAEFRRRIR